jgi:hypothetical protein
MIEEPPPHTDSPWERLRSRIVELQDAKDTVLNNFPISHASGIAR